MMYFNDEYLKTVDPKKNISQQLRDKTGDLIKILGRPVTSHEVETYLRVREPELWNELQSKCGDYVRVILGNTKNDIFRKYKTKIPIRGIDRRATFYGLVSQADQYSPAEWLEIAEKKDFFNQFEENSIFFTQEPEISSRVTYDSKTCKNVQENFCKSMDIATTEKSWNNLQKNVPHDHPLWSDIVKAINLIGLTFNNGIQKTGLLNEIMQMHDTFKDPNVHDDVKNIMIREIMIRSDIKLSSTL